MAELRERENRLGREKRPGFLSGQNEIFAEKNENSERIKVKGQQNPP